ncbi:MAG: hypothetical protein LBG73_10550 [Spirochaetaceae bacterium]|jgi:hypothetical protein|nr:hypothetical protein [Spirochaetaceae bacterium]
MKQKIAITLGLFLIGLISFGPLASIQMRNQPADTGIQRSLTEKTSMLLRVWTTLKVINGVINVLQSAEIGGSFFVEASVNPLEILAPLDNILDKLSDLLLWALGAVIMEKLLLSASGFFIFKVIIPVCMLLCIIPIWAKKNLIDIRRVVAVCMIFGLAISAAVPLSFQVSAAIEKGLFADRAGGLLASINDKGKNAESMEQDVAGLKRIGKSIVSFMGDAKQLGDALIEDIMNFLIIFFIANIGMPLLTILGIISAAKYAVRLLL